MTCSSQDSDVHKDVRPAVTSIHIIPSQDTEKWTFCSHSEDCTTDSHDNQSDRTPTLVIRLNEVLKEEVYLQKYDKHGNRQTFEKPMELEVQIVSKTGESLQMGAKIDSSMMKVTDRRKKLQLKDLLFTNGQLGPVRPTFEAVLRACVSADQHAVLRCQVLPGALAIVDVHTSKPSFSSRSMSFEAALHPGEIIKHLTLQGMDKCGNSIEEGQKMQVVLKGLSFLDNCGNEREVDENGCLQLGGRLQVTCHYNSEGSMTIFSGTESYCSINFKTVTRQLVATLVPDKSYVGRYLEGVCVTIVDEFGIVDTSVDGHSHSVTVNWLEGVTCPFTRGECSLPRFKLPEKPGFWKGKVHFSENTSLNVNLMVELELGTACTLGSARKKTEILTAECGVPFRFPFSINDAEDNIALLAQSVRESISPKAEPKEGGDEYNALSRPCTVALKDIRLLTTGDILSYEALLVLSGVAGFYTVSLTSSELTGVVQLPCSLQHGKIARLVLARVQEANQNASTPLHRLEVARLSRLPGLTVTVVDSEDNVCSSCENRKVIIKILGCSQWEVLATEISRGIGQFESTVVAVPVGDYQVIVEFETSPDNLYSLDEQDDTFQAKFSLTVKPGNYPSALRVLGSKTLRASLTGKAVQYLPQISVLVESHDGLTLQCQPAVGVKLFSRAASGSTEYLGTFVKTPKSDFASMCATDAGVNAIRYEFTQVCVPSQAGKHTLEFFVRESKVPSVFKELVVRHGPPVRADITKKEQGREIRKVQVNLVDAYGNKCEDISGLQMRLEVIQDTAVTMRSGFQPCALVSKSISIIEQGRGDFGALEFSPGGAGLYTMKVFAADRNVEKNLQTLVPAEARLLIIQGDVSAAINEQLENNMSLSRGNQECLMGIQSLKTGIRFRQAANTSLENEIRILERDYKVLEKQARDIETLQESANDVRTLKAEQPTYTEANIIHELQNLARNGNSSPWAFWVAQSNPKFSPQNAEPLKDFVGLVAFLARVESDSLNSGAIKKKHWRLPGFETVNCCKVDTGGIGGNQGRGEHYAEVVNLPIYVGERSFRENRLGKANRRILCEYLGNKLLMIVCRTQGGVNSLQAYTGAAIDESRGLAAFARMLGCKISGRYSVLALSDCSPYRGIVDIRHPQQILKINPPLLHGGQIPEGFLGYAVNLLHMKSEYIQMRVVTQQRRDAGLRESLFFHLLGMLQVYDTRENMVFAKERVHNFQGPAISLDGGIIRNREQMLGKPRDKPFIGFSMVPLEERMISTLLRSTAHDAIQRANELKATVTEMENIQKDLYERTKKLHDDVRELDTQQRCLDRTKLERENIEDKRRLILKQIAELDSAKRKIADINGPGRHSGSLHPDSNKQNRVQAFFI